MARRPGKGNWPCKPKSYDPRARELLLLLYTANPLDQGENPNGGVMGKRIAVRILAIASLALGLLAGSHRQAQAYTRISAGVEFYDALSPY